jgi:capsular exopolysaccharide synthesis family protein
LILGTAAGLVAAIGIVILSEMLNNKINSAAEVESQLKLPVLGTLPNRLLIEPGHLDRFLNNAAAIEPYRRLLKTLELSSKEQLKSILISSSVAGEGKSHVSAHLAIVAAMLSRRTLLIDADLEHPLQHQFFNLPAHPGLTDAVSEDTPLLSVVQSSVVAGLDVLTHGQWLNHPAQILEAVAMKKLMNEAMAHYDLVIVDTSPISQYMDAMTLSKHTDGVVVVVRPGFTPKAIALRTVEDLQKSGSSVLGAVLNVNPDPIKNDQLSTTATFDSTNKGFLGRKSLQSSI